MITRNIIGLALGAVLLLYFGYTPLWMYKIIAAVASTGFLALIPAAPKSDGSLREAMRNVTKDYDQVCQANCPTRGWYQQLPTGKKTGHADNACHMAYCMSKVATYIHQLCLSLQLAMSVQEFFGMNSILDPQTEERFREFLAQKAQRCYSCPSRRTCNRLCLL